ncbi:MAG: hypothetical protein ACYTBZ_07370, partial [Planctomycetota bacterium]
MGSFSDIIAAFEQVKHETPPEQQHFTKQYYDHLDHLSGRVVALYERRHDERVTGFEKKLEKFHDVRCHLIKHHQQRFPRIGLALGTDDETSPIPYIEESIIICQILSDLDAKAGTESNRGISLNNSQREIIQAMMELDATSPDKLRPAREIAERALPDGDPGKLKENLAKLTKWGYVESRT